MTPLSAREIDQALTRLPGWAHEEGMLRRTVRVQGFAPAFALATRVALLAERMNHHPELNVAWGRLTIALTTHSQGGITALDLRMAEAISQWIPSNV